MRIKSVEQRSSSSSTYLRLFKFSLFVTLEFIRLKYLSPISRLIQI